MTRPVIEVNHLGKSYRIGIEDNEPRAGLQVVTNALLTPFAYLRRTLRPPTDQEILWAIRDINFQVAEGEVLGIIGGNGAGKSTLLKILSRITDPSEGRAVLRGRVGSLLEVGTGFHPDLTGRENIFMKGTLLGMNKREIERKLDEIIEFSEIGRFLDTPVKRYSSGMGVRLGFAVAAHLEPEILIVDEVLAVGDLSFQRKCLAKMESVAGEGRTVLFVSHMMPSIQALCHRVILLEAGRIVREGTPTEIVNAYEDKQTVPGAGYVNLVNHPNRVSETSYFRSLRLRNKEGKESDRFRLGEKITFELEIDLGELNLTDPFVVLNIQRHNQTICYLTTHYMHKEMVHVNGKFIARCTWDPGFLAPGTYLIHGISLKRRSGGERLDKIQNVTSFEIFPTDVYGTGKVNFNDGIILPIGNWDFDHSIEQPLVPSISSAAEKLPEAV